MSTKPAIVSGAQRDAIAVFESDGAGNVVDVHYMCRECTDEPDAEWWPAYEWPDTDVYCEACCHAINVAPGTYVGELDYAIVKHPTSGEAYAVELDAGTIRRAVGPMRQVDSQVIDPVDGVPLTVEYLRELFAALDANASADAAADGEWLEQALRQ
jgi:hypothetical protein